MFNEPLWGTHCSSYVKSAKKLSASRLDEIITLSAEYMVKAGQNLEDENVIKIHGVSRSDPPGLLSMPFECCLVMFGSSFGA